VSAGLYYAFIQINAEDAEYFFDKLGSELNSDTPQPIFTLRKQLQDSRENSRGMVAGQRNARWMTAITIKTWNAFRNGDEIGQLKWRAGGAAPEAFPIPK
jgi:hypothetical protein